MKDPNEDKIDEMTRSMGLKLRTKIVVLFIMLTMFMCILSAPLFVIMKLVFFKKSDLFIVFLSLLMYTYGYMMQIIFLIFVTGKVGFIISISINLFNTYMSPFIFKNVPGATMSYVITFLLPSTGINTFIKIISSLETTSEVGLSFSTLFDEVYNN